MVLSICTDWVEHVLETDAEPYLRTPEEELSFVARHNLDVYLWVAIMVIALGIKLLSSLWKMVSIMVGGLVHALRVFMIHWIRWHQ